MSRNLRAYRNGREIDAYYSMHTRVEKDISYPG
jgi:hypothetical protein